MQQYYQYYQYYQQSSLQRPAGIPQDTMLADPWTLGHTNQMEGPIDPRHIQLAQFSTIDGPNGFATPTCEQPGSLVDFPSPSPHPKDIKPINSRTIKQQLTGRIEFNTDVDQLLRAIHREDLNGATAVKEEPLMLSPSPSPKGASMLPFAHPPTLAKMFRCTQPGCNGVFSQKAHLTTHTRVHTGEKPYKCEFPGCDQHFTQAGNMKSHMRRHNGVRPFKCSFCDKRFSQQSITKTHEKTHSQLKPFKCILEGCNKRFSLRGNMKSHLNAFHSAALVELTTKFVGFAKQGWVPEECREVQDFFTEHFKNSNKGIKGRGKARKVARWSVGNHTPSEVDAEGTAPKFEPESPWEPQYPSDFGNYAPPSPISIAGQIFPGQDYSSPMAADTPYY